MADPLDLGPVSVLVCWQSIVLALSIAIVTNGAKRVIDWKSGGSAERKKKLFVNRVVLPGIPILIGALVACLVPLHPDALTQYLTDHAYVGFKKYAILAAYGVVLGQFSDYVWHRYSGLKNDVAKRGKSNESESSSSESPTA